MAMSQDSDIVAIIPDILTLGISSFSTEHAKAQAEIERRLRRDWFPKAGYSGEMNATLLTQSQFTTASSYLVLIDYALPKLSTWQEGDRFTMMIAFYKSKYEQEFSAVLKDGVEYDADSSGTISTSEKSPTHFGRLSR